MVVKIVDVEMIEVVLVFEFDWLVILMDYLLDLFSESVLNELEVVIGNDDSVEVVDNL